MHARGTLLAAACGLDQAAEDFDEEDLYGAMDLLSGRWVGIGLLPLFAAPLAWATASCSK
jgi:hypothetical protein